MRYLLDTHAFLWWVLDDQKLSTKARQELAKGTTELFLSAASGWEMAIKVSLGRLSIPGDLEALVAQELQANRIRALPVEMSHALHVSKLPALHRDPFDRILISQALLEGMHIVTCDAAIHKYEVPTLW